MKKISILFVLIALCISSFAQEAESKKKLGVFASMDLQSESIWLGWDIANDEPSYIPCVVLDLWGTGFSTIFWASMPVDREHKAYDDFELILKYNHNLFANKKGEMNFHGFIDYIWVPGQDEFPHHPILNDNGTYIAQTGLKQLWKLNIGVSFNNLIPVGDSYIVPSYDIFYITPANTAYFQPGSIHDLSFAYSRPLGKIANLNISNHTLYHSRIFGVEALAANYTTAIVGFPFGKGFSLNAQASYQFSMEDAVNPDDEFWTGVGLSYSF